LLQPGQSLSQRAVRGGIWVFALRITRRILGMGRTIILARLLAPSDFGLMGIAGLAMSTLDIFSRTGFGTALIQKKEDTDKYLNTAWTISVLRGVVLFAILFFSAPLIAVFFKNAEVTPILKVIAISFLLGGLTNIGIIYFQKELDFGKQFIYQLSRTIASISVSITLAFILRNVWVLVYAMLAGGIVGLVTSYSLHPYRPKISLDTKKIKDLFSFGKWMLGSSIIIFLATQGDDAFLGKVLGVTALGFYQMAFNLSNMPVTEITHVISQVAFPAYSRLQDDLSKLKEAYLKILQLTTFISMPLAAGIFILAPDLTWILLGQKWMPMAPALRVLAISGLIRSVTAVGGALFLGIGKPNEDFRMNVLRVLTLAISIYPLTKIWGITGTSLSVVLAIFATIPVWLKVSMRETNLKLMCIVKALLFPLVSSVVMMMIILIIRHLLVQIELQELILLTISGIFSYLGMSYILQEAFNYEIFIQLKYVINRVQSLI